MHNLVVAADHSKARHFVREEIARHDLVVLKHRLRHWLIWQAPEYWSKPHEDNVNSTST